MQDWLCSDFCLGHPPGSTRSSSPPLQRLSSMAIPSSHSPGDAQRNRHGLPASLETESTLTCTKHLLHTQAFFPCMRCLPTPSHKPTTATWPTSAPTTYSLCINTPQIHFLAHAHSISTYLPSVRTPHEPYSYTAYESPQHSFLTHHCAGILQHLLHTKPNIPLQHSLSIILPTCPLSTNPFRNPPYNFFHISLHIKPQISPSATPLNIPFPCTHIDH